MQKAIAQLTASNLNKAREGGSTNFFSTFQSAAEEGPDNWHVLEARVEGQNPPQLIRIVPDQL